MTQHTLLIGLVCNFLFFVPAFAQDTIGWPPTAPGDTPSRPAQGMGRGQERRLENKDAVLQRRHAGHRRRQDFHLFRSHFVDLRQQDRRQNSLGTEKHLAELPLTEDDKEKLKAEREQDALWSKQQQQFDKQANAVEKLLKDEPDKERAKLVAKDATSFHASQRFPQKARGPADLAALTNAPRNGAAGYSQCTPVCNGKQLFVMYGNGLVACHDLDGTRRWLKFIEHNTAAYGHRRCSRRRAGCRWAPCCCWRRHSDRGRRSSVWGRPFLSPFQKIVN